MLLVSSRSARDAFFFLKVQNKTVTLRQKDYFTDRTAQGDQLFTFSSLPYLDLRSNFSLALALPPRILLKTLFLLCYIVI